MTGETLAPQLTVTAEGQREGRIGDERVVVIEVLPPLAGRVGFGGLAGQKINAAGPSITPNGWPHRLANNVVRQRSWMHQAWLYRARILLRRTTLKVGSNAPLR